MLIINKKQDYFTDEIGVLSPNQLQVDELYAGEASFLTFWSTYLLEFTLPEI